MLNLSILDVCFYPVELESSEYKFLRVLNDEFYVVDTNNSLNNRSRRAIKGVHERSQRRYR